MVEVTRTSPKNRAKRTLVRTTTVGPRTTNASSTHTHTLPPHRGWDFTAYTGWPIVLCRPFPPRVISIRGEIAMTIERIRERLSVYRETSLMRPRCKYRRVWCTGLMKRGLNLVSLTQREGFIYLIDWLILIFVTFVHPQNIPHLCVPLLFFFHLVLFRSLSISFFFFISTNSFSFCFCGSDSFLRFHSQFLFFISFHEFLLQLSVRFIFFSFFLLSRKPFTNPSHIE